MRLQLEDLHRGLPRGLSRRPVPSRARQLRRLRQPALGDGARLLRADGGRGQRARQGRLRRLQEVARGGARLPRRRASETRRDLAHLLPERDARVVPARAGRLDAVPAGAAARRSTWSSSTTPRRSSPSSASSSRRSRPPTWRPASRTTRSRCAWMPAARALYERGDDEFGPYQSPMEDGMQQFHEWYRRQTARVGPVPSRLLGRARPARVATQPPAGVECAMERHAGATRLPTR